MHWFIHQLKSVAVTLNLALAEHLCSPLTDLLYLAYACRSFACDRQLNCEQSVCKCHGIISASLKIASRSYFLWHLWTSENDSPCVSPVVAQDRLLGLHIQRRPHHLLWLPSECNYLTFDRWRRSRRVCALQLFHLFFIMDAITFAMSH